jgi:hypothetical protein
MTKSAMLYVSIHVTIILDTLSQDKFRFLFQLVYEDDRCEEIIGTALT